MSEVAARATSCVASIANGQNGKVAIICGTVVLLYGITAAWYLIDHGHTVTFASGSTRIEVA